MRSIIDITRINKTYPFVGRAAMRSMTGTLNFTIANLCAADIRAKTVGGLMPGGVDLNPLLAKYGNTLDKRNEQDEAARGAAHENAMREEQGFNGPVPPLEMAGRLKIIRDVMAADMEDNCVLLPNPLKPGSTYIDPWSIATPLEDSFRKQLLQVPKVNEKNVEAMCKAVGIPTVTMDDIRLVMTGQQEAGIRFLKAHGEDILAYFANLTAKGSDGHTLTLDDAVDIEMALPAQRRASLFVAADRGLWYERQRQIGLIMRSHPDAAGNMKFVDGTREEIHAEFEKLMADPVFKAGIDEAVQRGSRWPVLLDLPVAVPLSTQKAA